VSLFSVFNMTFPDDQSLFKIYNSILAGHFTPFDYTIREMSPKITNMTMQLYQ
jgi:dynein heavy chain